MDTVIAQAPPPKSRSVISLAGDGDWLPFVDGAQVAGTAGRLDDLNPWDGNIFAHVQLAGQDMIETAIHAATLAQRSWWSMGPGMRERLLLRTAELLEARGDDLVDTLVREGGSTIGKARFEIHAAADMIRGAAGECRRVFGETMPSDIDGLLSLSVRRPIGVVAAILPFNFPLILGAKKLAFALAAGNGVVAKPSPHTPVIGLKLAQAFHDAGVPSGLVNMLPSDAALFADTAMEHPAVGMITFTGSTAVGRELAAKAGRHLKRITLELGGKSPIVVLADADLDYAAHAACFGIALHQGQVCMVNSRVVVDASVHDEFVAKLADRLRALKHGDPDDPHTVIGPLIDSSKIPGLLDQLSHEVERGATIVCGGKADGPVLLPTLVTGIGPDSRLFNEESFGPIISVVCADDDAHALELANHSTFGLSSAVITNDLRKALRFAEGLEAGMVHINGSSILDEPLIPFGGVKASGIGREGGRHSIEAMTELKWITIAREDRSFPF